MISCGRVYWMCHFISWITLEIFPGCVLLLSKRNLIARYPVIFNFRVGTGRVLEKKVQDGSSTGIPSGPDQHQYRHHCHLGNHPNGHGASKVFIRILKVIARICLTNSSMTSQFVSWPGSFFTNTAGKKKPPN